MNQENQSTAAAINAISALTLAAKPYNEIGQTHHLVIPEGFKHIDISKAIEAALPEPTRKQGSLIVHDLNSLLVYATDQDQKDTGYIYVDQDKRSITAIFNDQKSSSRTGWRDHRVTFTAEFSREFANWISRDQKQMEQEDFAIFLEDNIADIKDGSTLLAVALSLQAKTEVNFSSSKRLDNGQVQFTYTENMEARAAGGNIDVPREFTLAIRIFKNGPGYAIKARLKYRLNSAKLKFWYELDRPDDSIEDAFKEYVTQLSECGYTVLLGKP